MNAQNVANTIWGLATLGWQPGEGPMQAGDGPSKSMCTVKALLRGECSLLCFVVSEGAA
jgi:hypothetical protein